MNIKNCLPFLCIYTCIGIYFTTAVAICQEPNAITPDYATELTEAEQAFSDLMTDATLVGSFTDSNHAAGELHEEKYVLGKVRKLKNGQWLIQTRIQYGQHDVTIPLTLPVEWAGDTPVIIVDQLAMPGMGTYSARVLIQDGRYAGYWQGATHGGHLFGKVKGKEERANDSQND